MSKKVLVIGVDGGTWDALGPYIRDGVMPGLGRILDDGASGTLRSVIPAITPTAWVSFATGVNPGRHGCFNFVNMRSFGDFRPINASDIKAETVYETLAGNGYRCTVINLPVSYPPRIERTVITSHMTPGDDFVYPPELVDEVPSLERYEIGPKDAYPLARTVFPHDSDIIIDNEQARFNVARDLFVREWDFFFVLFSGSDWIQHRAFGEMMSGEGPKAEGARKYFEKLDGWISWFFENAEPETLRIIMSDHGFRMTRGTFAVNSWLEEEGFIKYLPGPSPEKEESAVLNMAFKGMPTPDTVKAPVAEASFAFKRSRATAWMVPVAKKVLKRSDRLWRLVSNEYHPDFADGTAYYFFPSIYVSEDRGNRDEIVDGVIRGLEDMDRRVGLFQGIARREDIYWGPYVGDAPSVLFIGPEYGCFAPRRKELLVDKPIPDHSKDGIFVVSGADGLSGNDHSASIMDICPTIVDWMGIEPPHRYDGESLLRRLRGRDAGEFG